MCDCRRFIFANDGCSFSFHSLDGVEFGRAGGVSINRIISAFTVILLVVCGVLSLGLNYYRDNAIAYKEQRDKATSIIDDMQKRQRDVAELDARYTKELADAKSTTGASSMGDGESPGLTADAELNYYRLRSGIDKITAQVNYLQEYIRTQCLK